VVVPFLAGLPIVVWWLGATLGGYLVGSLLVLAVLYGVLARRTDRYSRGWPVVATGVSLLLALALWLYGGAPYWPWVLGTAGPVAVAGAGWLGMRAYRHQRERITVARATRERAELERQRLIQQQLAQAEREEADRLRREEAARQWEADRPRREQLEAERRRREAEAAAEREQRRREQEQADRRRKEEERREQEAAAAHRERLRRAKATQVEIAENEARTCPFEVLTERNRALLRHSYRAGRVGIRVPLAELVSADVAGIAEVLVTAYRLRDIDLIDIEHESPFTWSESVVLTQKGAEAVVEDGRTSGDQYVFQAPVQAGSIGPAKIGEINIGGHNVSNPVRGLWAAAEELKKHVDAEEIGEIEEVQSDLVADDPSPDSLRRGARRLAGIAHLAGAAGAPVLAAVAQLVQAIKS
jgi:hypothetical protein